MNLISGLVSIAIPAYKDKYLKEAIESALNQDYKNIELIIVNDDSPYPIDEIVKSYYDSRIIYYRNNENIGRKSVAYNWNQCLSYAKGEFFVLLCDDDILDPLFVSELVGLAKKYPQCSVFHATRQVCKDGVVLPWGNNQWSIYEDYDSFIENKMNGKRMHTITEFLYRTDFIKSIGYAVFPVGYFSDDVSILMFAKHSKCIVSSNKCLATFRVSSVHISSDNTLIISKVVAHKKYIKWLKHREEFCKYISSQKRVYNDTIWKYFYQSNSKQKMLLLFYIPLSYANIKKLFTYYKSRLITRFSKL